MACHIDGPLYYERMGRTGPVMAFVHPNPMDQSCWIFQMAQVSTWFRCIAIDIPGYGRSPKARPGLTMQDIAQACWEAVDEIAPGEQAILVGCSVGSAVVTYMHHRHPQRTAALVLSGTGYNPGKEFAHRRIAAYKQHGSAIAMLTCRPSFINSRRTRSRMPRISRPGSPARRSSSAAARTQRIKAHLL
jgi:pimeloyl-ACP methyl ester carboxylesterase